MGNSQKIVIPGNFKDRFYEKDCKGGEAKGEKGDGKRRCSTGAAQREKMERGSGRVVN